MWVWVVVCLYMSALWQTADLSRVYPAACPVPAGIGSSSPAAPLRISGIDNGWMNVDVKVVNIMGNGKEI